MKVKVKIKKLDKAAKIPVYASPFSAGADLYACEENRIEVKPQETVLIHTGLSFEIPENYVGLIYARSGLAVKEGLAPANKVGVIDSDYRGEVLVAIYNQSGSVREIVPGERIAQMIITPFAKAEFEYSDSLSETKRGGGGFGSTGAK